MLIIGVVITCVVLLAVALLVVPWRFARFGLVGSMLWTALAGAIYFANSHNPDPWAHMMDDVQHAIGIGVLGYAAIWLVLAMTSHARHRRVGRVGVAATGN